MHTLIILLGDECFGYVVEHRATVIIDVVPECLSPLLVFGKDIVEYPLSLECFPQESLKCRLIFARAPVPNEDSSLVLVESFEHFLLVGASGKVVWESDLHYACHLIVIVQELLLLLSVTCFGLPYSLSKYISKALISHFFAFASRVITRSLSTSSIDWSLAIFSIASRKRVSTDLLHTGRQGFHSWNLVDGLGFGFAIFRYYSDITDL